MHGARRVLLHESFHRSRDRVRLHVITANKYRGGRLYVWLPGQRSEFIEASGEEPAGVLLRCRDERRRAALCAFKVVTGAWKIRRRRCQPAVDVARRRRSMDPRRHRRHGGSPPAKRAVTVHYRQGTGLDEAPTLHVWGVASDFVVDVAGAPNRTAPGASPHPRSTRGTSIGSSSSTRRARKTNADGSTAEAERRNRDRSSTTSSSGRWRAITSSTRLSPAVIAPCRWRWSIGRHRVVSTVLWCSTSGSIARVVSCTAA